MTENWKDKSRRTVKATSTGKVTQAFEDPTYVPGSDTISTYYNYQQRQRHEAARRRAKVEVTAGAKALLFGVAAALIVVIGLAL
jgi:hypothetical protein